MHYPEPIERSAEILRLAIARMTRHPAAFHPLTYAVWYEYASGGNAELNREIDARTEPMDDAAVRALYLAHVADSDTASIELARGGIERAAVEIADTAREAGDRTRAFRDGIHRSRMALDDAHGVSGVEALLAKVQLEAQRMETAVGAIEGRLEQSRQRIVELRAELERSGEPMLVDVLTGLASRIAFERALAQTGGTPCMALLDIDRFARLNESYGHLFGDRVIVAVGQLLQQSVPLSAVAARWSGNGFALLLPDTSLAEATRLADRWIERMARIQIRRKGFVEPVGSITASIGIALRAEGEPADLFAARCAEALARAKNEGRDRRIVSSGA